MKSENAKNSERFFLLHFKIKLSLWRPKLNDPFFSTMLKKTSAKEKIINKTTSCISVNFYWKSHSQEHRGEIEQLIEQSWNENEAWSLITNEDIGNFTTLS